jgi:diacylglycerol kinase (ATP)
VLRLLKATLNSWNGLRAAARSEQAFREEIVALLIAVPAAFFLATETWRRVMLIAVVVLLMIVELLNTAIEKLSDHVTPHHHDAIGRIRIWRRPRSGWRCCCADWCGWWRSPSAWG